MRFIYSKGHVDVEHDGKTARFHGDICTHGFIALVFSMEWMAPEKGAPVTEEDRRELVRLINRNATPTSNKFYFVDDDYYALDYYNNL
jgi:hypothetical protein